MYVKAYETAYEKGYKSTKKAVEKAGYKYAFENYDLKVPAKYEKNESLRNGLLKDLNQIKKQQKLEKKDIKKETVGLHSSIRILCQVNIKNIKICTNKR